MKLNHIALVMAVMGACGGVSLGAAAADPASAKVDINTIDPDHDGKLDLKEAQAAAEAKFAQLDTDHDGTLDKTEMAAVMGKRSFAHADPDKDGTVDKAEYMKLVEHRFKAADPDHDGSLSQDELQSKSGQSLARLLQ
jgi:Ca2+-binding EF-hand superfamily protein